MIRFRSDERGVAMVAVMGVLLVTSILGFAVAATAQRTSEDGVRDSNAKRALAAAETGLNTARFGVGKQFGNATPAQNVINDQTCYPASCTWTSPIDAGNGATFSYTVSQVLTTATDATCVPAVTPPNPTNSRQRCVTAVGEINNVKRQVQTRVIENRGAPIFPFPGLLGLDRVALNKADAEGAVGTNGQLVIGPDSDVINPGTIKLGGSSWSVTPTGYGTPNRQVSPDPFTLDFHAEWYSNSVKAPSGSGDTSAPTYGTNRIGDLTTQAGFLVAPTRQASLAPGSTVTLSGGSDYNFCSLKLNSGANFVVPYGTTDPVRIFIDSSTRPGSPDYVPSGCLALSGKALDVANQAGFINNTGKPSMLQVYVYSGEVEFNASTEMTGVLWAPQSKVTFNAGAVLKGAIAAKDIEFKQNDGATGFFGDIDADNVTGRWDGSYKRNGWRECSPSVGCQ